MTQTPNPNSRRRRLTADELIAILVAMTGIGTIFWWSISHRQPQVMNAATKSETAPDNGEIVQTFPLTNSAITTKTKVRSVIVPSQSVPSPAVSPLPSSSIVATAAAGGAAAGVVVGTNGPPVAASAAPAPSTAAFTDVPAQYWGKGYIAVLQERGVLADFGTGKFEPDLPVTRGEYAKMLDRAFDRPVSQQVLEFKDIPANYPRRAAVDKAVKMGFMSGYSKTKFSPDEQIPRYQMQISLAKGLGLEIPANVNAILAKYPDANAMPKYARQKMAAAIDANLIVKDDRATKLQPVKPTTRGEAAALLYQALVQDGKIPAGK